MKLRHFIISAVSSIITLSAFAGGADYAAIPKPKSYGYQIDPEPWIISSDLYMWLPNMSGHVTVDHVRYKVKQRYEKVLRHVRVGGMFWLTASKGPFSMFFNGLYAQLAYHEYIDGDKIKTRNNFALITGGFSYRAYRRILDESGPTITSSFSIVPYIGLRAAMVDTVIKAVESTPNITEDQHWIQPILGSRFIYQFGTNWGLTFAGDYGYWGDKSRSINLLSLLSYNNLFGVPALSLHLGYRYLHQYYECNSGKYKWDMNLYGPVIGMSVTI